MKKPVSTFILLLLCTMASYAQPRFRAVAFFTGKHDQAHISFIREAHPWFSALAAREGFVYDTTSNWDNMNDTFLLRYQVVIFLDSRPDGAAQRAAFEKYMRNGGGWLGFHFAAFALTPSQYPQNWDWYHETFLGSGSYASNTWRPTAAVLQVENNTHPATRHLPDTFRSAPNEWYRWSNNLRRNPDINILLSVHPASFPLGTGPKPHEIWRSGDYPVAWTNTKYRMLYMNMGHNDIDYEHQTKATLSYTFGNAIQSKLIADALLWLGGR
ncbi:ThuA domain-containing protein [Chitinophaga lutea]|uniref:ThuA domain-containing protein n=1 Tax=Chitinophaga lutea TaxID=2488634 RepID=A0A3N4PD99_9BACT|nr:ThuA domain-containing protein [Chitinophaga lutea]RPE05398.1 ThuA domain-containing protein [Chitinophaga lutea]